ncbi:hypothetical protein CRUP_025605 [Coryphaenoides rupestris]|nr:hypothetical protein CRUP_025605 [Coryphaenoides rupestris]
MEAASANTAMETGLLCVARPRTHWPPSLAPLALDLVLGGPGASTSLNNAGPKTCPAQRSPGVFHEPPVNRIPIMAKQVLDLYKLYKLVTEKGGLVEVINKKIWREITKGLNLPTSITSAAFTLRTQ